MILTSPSLASRHVSSPPRTKWSMSSPKVLPVLGQSPVFLMRTSLNAASTHYTYKQHSKDILVVKLLRKLW